MGDPMERGVQRGGAKRKPINPFPESPKSPSVLNEHTFSVTEGVSLSPGVRGSGGGRFAVEICVLPKPVSIWAAPEGHLSTQSKAGLGVRDLELVPEGSSAFIPGLGTLPGAGTSPG